MKRTTRLLAFLCVLGVCLQQIRLASGWGTEGHSIVAGLAQTRLTPQSLAWIAYLTGNNTATLVDICAEADSYDESPGGQWSAPLHFANVPFLTPRFDYARDCTFAIGFQCVVSAIMNFSLVLEEQVRTATPNHLRTARLAPPTDLVAPQYPEPSPLAFVTHFVGDVHQPLHVSYGCDEGGNLVNTSQYWIGDKRQYYVLHKIWDSIIIETYSTSWQTWVNHLNDEIAKNPALAADAVENFTPIHWADESYNITLTYGYWFDIPDYPTAAETQQPHYPSDKYCPLPGIVDLSDAYKDNVLPVLSNRLLQGGVRLAALLNSIFATNTPPTV